MVITFIRHLEMIRQSVLILSVTVNALAAQHCSICCGRTQMMPFKYHFNDLHTDGTEIVMDSHCFKGRGC